MISALSGTKTIVENVGRYSEDIRMAAEGRKSLSSSAIKARIEYIEKAYGWVSNVAEEWSKYIDAATKGSMELLFPEIVSYAKSINEKLKELKEITKT